jgi:hypothetical protein
LTILTNLSFAMFNFHLVFGRFVRLLGALFFFTNLRFLLGFLTLLVASFWEGSTVANDSKIDSNPNITSIDTFLSRFVIREYFLGMTLVKLINSSGLDQQELVRFGDVVESLIVLAEPIISF